MLVHINILRQVVRNIYPYVFFKTNYSLYFQTNWGRPTGNFLRRPFHRPPYCLRQQGPTPVDTCSGNNRRAGAAAPAEIAFQLRTHHRRWGGGWFPAKRLRSKLVLRQLAGNCRTAPLMRCSFRPPILVFLNGQQLNHCHPAGKYKKFYPWSCTQQYIHCTIKIV